jgi:gentisate 1,2-dioxygenase
MKLEELDSQLEKNQLSGFWHSECSSHARGTLSVEVGALLDGLLKASETIGIDQAERRAIRLVSRICDQVDSHTLQITFSIVNPGEVAKRIAIIWRRSVSSSRARCLHGWTAKVLHGRGRSDLNA